MVPGETLPLLSGRMVSALVKLVDISTTATVGPMGVRSYYTDPARRVI